MPKTDVKKPESEDLAELSDEALDRTSDAQVYIVCASVGGCASSSSCIT